MAIRIALLALSLIACAAPPTLHAPFPEAGGADAAALLDLGSNPTACTLACFDFAAAVPPCREARADCVSTCERAVADSLLSPRLINCVATAGKSREAIHACGDVCP